LYQLKPVFGSAIFSFHHDLPVKHLWRNYFKAIVLSNSYRQNTDNNYASLLNMVRTGQHTASDINTLKTRMNTKPHIHIQHIFPIKDLCNAHNRELVQNLTKEGSIMYIIDAIDDPSDENIPQDDQDCAGIHKSLALCIGCRVMLLRNIQTNCGLVNGAQGYVTSFQWKNGKNQQHKGELPFEVNILFDNPKSILIRPITVPFMPT
jgi:hypothetical protein